MAGIYIHIPFCKQACHYCNFHFSTNSKGIDEMVQSILKEVDLRKDFLGSNAVINTIYLGGGTPSLLSTTQLSSLINDLTHRFQVAGDVEITLEANPDDLTKEKLQGFKAAGINRLSIGVQSFIDSELQLMNRAHVAEESLSCIKGAQDVGITNISIDLIFGVQGSTLASWQSNLEQALELEVPHLSCYNLTVEPQTALAHFVKSGKVSDVDSALSAEQFGLTMDILEGAGFDHYEISNYAKKGYISRHNSSYWRSVPYLGLGPSAHSFDGTNRSWNIANNALYSRAIALDTLATTEEDLVVKDRINEYIMTGLRTKWGCDLDKIEDLLKGSRGVILQEATPFLNQKLLELDNSILILTKEGKYYADQIASDLFLID